MARRQSGRKTPKFLLKTPNEWFKTDVIIVRDQTNDPASDVTPGHF
ncbi:hypothetical protein [Lentibacillus salicampi]|nr:hypothetical protein [Lentibacillus salicampi]